MIFSRDRVVDQPLERLSVGAVFENLAPHLASEVFVRQVSRVNVRRQAPRLYTLVAQGKTIRAPYPKGRKLGVALRRLVATRKTFREVVAPGIQIGGALQVFYDGGLVSRPVEVLRGASHVARLFRMVGLEVANRHRGASRAIPGVGRREAALGALPKADVFATFGGIRKSLSRGARLAESLAQMTEPLEKSGSRFGVVDPRHRVGNHSRRVFYRARLLEQGRRLSDGLFVIGHQPGNPLPSAGCGRQVASLLLVKSRDALLEGDLFLEIGLGGRGLFEQGREVVPSRALFEPSNERGAGGFVFGVEGHELPVRPDRAVHVVQLTFAELGDFAQLLFARLGRRAHARGREQDVAKRLVVACGAQVVERPCEGLGVGRIAREKRGVFRLRLGLVLASGFQAESPRGLDRGSLRGARLFLCRSSRRGHLRRCYERRS